MERGEETLLRPLQRNKALEGEAHERWELKEASKAVRTETPVMRVAKP